MNSLFIILVVIIILSIIYLYYRHIQYNKILESFDNNSYTTQSSLSTYYQNTVDADERMTYDNVYNKELPLIEGKKGWSGVWQNSSAQINSQIFQVNDNIFIALHHNNLLHNLGSGTTDNIFLGVGKLNGNRNIFILTNVIKNNFRHNSLGLEVSELSGEINDTGKIITLYSNNSSRTLKLNKTNELKYNDSLFYRENLYTKKLSKFITPYPELPSSSIKKTNIYCPPGKKTCKVNNLGIGNTLSNQDFNACGNDTVSDEDNSCVGDPVCLYYTPPSGSSMPTNSKNTAYTKCNINVQVDDYMNFYLFNSVLKNNDTGLNICSYLNQFKKHYNSFIICYVSDLGEVKTLNYQFFGAMPEDSTLTVQKDMMNDILNNPPHGILHKYRKNMFIGNKDHKKDGLSFMNCVEFNETPDTPHNIEKKCLLMAKSHIHKYKPPKRNSKLFPVVWSINHGQSKNYLNSCFFSLSTSKLYDTPIKYVEYNNNETNLSIYGGGLDQSFLFEHMRVINKNKDSIIFTTNIRANNELYLVPSIQENGFMRNSNSTELVKNPYINGKWLFIGFHLKNIEHLDNKLRSKIFSPHI